MSEDGAAGLVSSEAKRPSPVRENDDDGPKSTIFRPFEAEWRALSNAIDNRPRQALLCRVEMKN